VRREEWRFSLKSFCEKQRRMNCSILASQEVLVGHCGLEVVEHSVVVLIHLEDRHPVGADLVAEFR